MRTASGWTGRLLGALLLAGGFAAGFLAGTWSGEPPVAGPEAGAPEHATRSTPPAEALPVRVEPLGNGPRLAGANAADLEPWRSAIAALPPVAVPRGTGVLSGSVRTKAGTPVPGVRVTAYPALPKSLFPPRADTVAEADLPAAVHTYVQSLRWSRASRLEVLTEKDGTYTFAELADVRHRLLAEREGWRIRTSGTSWVRPGTEVDFVATQYARVRVLLTLPDGSQPEHARLSFQGASSNIGRTWRATSPEVEVEPGTYEVTATSGDTSGLKSKSVPLTLEDAGPVPEIRLVLEGHPLILGRLVFPPGEPAPNAQVRIVRLHTGQRADPALLPPDAREVTVSAFPDHEFTFEFARLSPGRFLLGVARAWRGRVVHVQEVEVGNGPVEVSLAVPPLERKEYAVLRVRGPDGKPVADVEFRTGFRSESARSSGGSATVARGDGVWWVLHHENVEPGAKDAWLWIEVSSRRYGRRKLEYEPGSAPTFEVDFAEPGSLDVTVTELAGTRYEGRVAASLQRRRGTETEWVSRTANSLDAQAHIAFQGVQPGRYVVVLHLTGSSFDNPVLGREDVEIGPGANETRIALPALYVVAFEGLTQQGRISRRGGRAYHRHVPGTADGRTTVDAVPAGTYTISSGSGTATFTVPGAATVQLHALPK